MDEPLSSRPGSAKATCANATSSAVTDGLDGLRRRESKPKVLSINKTQRLAYALLIGNFVFIL